jgi:hypothetical protein
MSLFSTVHKILSNTLRTLLTEYVDEIIADHQRGFWSDRWLLIRYSSVDSEEQIRVNGLANHLFAHYNNVYEWFVFQLGQKYYTVLQLILMAIHMKLIGLVTEMSKPETRSKISTGDHLRDALLFRMEWNIRRCYLHCSSSMPSNTPLGKSKKARRICYWTAHINVWYMPIIKVIGVKHKYSNSICTVKKSK